MNKEDYINDRLEDQISWYDKKSMYNQSWHKRFRLTEIIAASLIPFLAGIGKSIEYSEWVIGGLGVIIAVSAAASSLYKFQENWIQYRTTSETLKHEKYLYLTKSHPYLGDNAFAQLVQRVEALISKENSLWSSYIRKSESAEGDEHNKSLNPTA